MNPKPALLLHVCCGPCATAVIERLSPRFQVTAFWHNPNIQPREEHDLRLEQAVVVARELGVELVVGERDEEGWLEAVAGLEGEPEGGARCGVCFQYRLRRAAREASSRGIPTLASTLSISPHKPAADVNTVGRAVAAESGVEFLEEDFSAADGFSRSVEVSKQMSLYRQRFCGCAFARREQER